MASRGEYAKGRARREQILGEAVRLFAEAGYRGASLRDLAARCDLSLAGLLHHVGDKESLLLAVLQRRDEDDAAESDLTGRTGRDRLRALTDVVRRNQSRRGIVELYSVLSAEATSVDHPAHTFFERRYERIVASLEEAFGECGHPTPASAARRLVAVVDGLQVQWLLHADGVDGGVDGGVDMAAEVERQIALELGGGPVRP